MVFIPLMHRRFAHICIQRGYFGFEVGPIWMFLARLNPDDPGEGWILFALVGGSYKRAGKSYSRVFGKKKYGLRWVL